jgi:hypothetical protein
MPEPSPERRGVSIVDWKRLRKNTLCGFTGVKIERINLRIDDVAIHQKGPLRRASPASR